MIKLVNKKNVWELENLNEHTLISNSGLASHTTLVQFVLSKLSTIGWIIHKE